MMPRQAEGDGRLAAGEIEDVLAVDAAMGPEPFRDGPGQQIQFLLVAALLVLRPPEAIIGPAPVAEPMMS